MGRRWENSSHLVACVSMSVPRSHMLREMSSVGWIKAQRAVSTVRIGGYALRALSTLRLEFCERNALGFQNIKKRGCDLRKRNGVSSPPSVGRRWKNSSHLVACVSMSVPRSHMLREMCSVGWIKAQRAVSTIRIGGYALRALSTLRLEFCERNTLGPQNI